MTSSLLSRARGARITFLAIAASLASAVHAGATGTLPPTPAGEAALIYAASPRAKVTFLPVARSNQDTTRSDAPAAAAEERLGGRSFFGTLWHNLGDDVRHMPRLNSLYWLVAGSAVALAAHPADRTVNRRVAGNVSFNRFERPGRYLGAQAQIGLGVTTYLIGRLRSADKARHLGMDLMEAQILTEGLVELTKISVQRPRPLQPNGVAPSAGYSFPSGHAAVTFATATVLQQHLGPKYGVPTYAVAVYVAISRLVDNVHYLSDVIFGATVGIVVGRSVTWHGRHTFTVAPLPMPGGMGVAISWK